MSFVSSAKLALKRILNYNVPGRYMKIRKSDIFLVSYPKSGNTWMRFLFGNILYDSKIDFKNINKLVPDIYMTKKKEIDQLNSPRVIKSHSSLDIKLPKVIYIYRDPRDVVVSYYYWYKKFNKENSNSFNEFFNAFMEGNVSYGLWSEHIKGWLEEAERRPDDILPVRYEDLKADTFDEFKRILDFCNIRRSDNEIWDAVKKSDFKTMSRLEDKQSKDSFLNKSDSSIKFVRSGKSEWRNILTKNQVQRINNEFKPLINKYL